MHWYGVLHHDPRDRVRRIIQAGRVREHPTVNVERLFVGEALVRIPVGRYGEGLTAVTVGAGGWQSWLAGLVTAGKLNGYRGTNAGPHGVITSQCLVIDATGRPWTLSHIVNRLDFRSGDVGVHGIITYIVVRTWVLSLILFAVIDVTNNTADKDRRIFSNSRLVFDTHFAKFFNCTMIVVSRTWRVF